MAKSAGTGRGRDTQHGSARDFTLLVYCVQFFFGGWFVAHGLNHWLEFFPRPSGSSPISKELIGALNHSGLFPIVKVIEVVTGAMLLANRAVPLAAVAAFPVTLSIAHLNIVGNGDIFSIGVGIVAISMNGLIALGHLDRFLPMLSVHQGDPSLAGLCSLAKTSAPSGSSAMQLRGWRHGFAILAGLAASIGFTFWATSDGGARSKAHYAALDKPMMKPADVVRALLAARGSTGAGSPRKIRRVISEDETVIVLHEAAMGGDSKVDVYRVIDGAVTGAAQSFSRLEGPSQ